MTELKWKTFYKIAYTMQSLQKVFTFLFKYKCRDFINTL